MLAKTHGSQNTVAQGGANVARVMRAELKRRAAIAEAGPKVVDMTEARRPLGKASSIGALFFRPASASIAESSSDEGGLVLPLRRNEKAVPAGQLSQPLKQGLYLEPKAIVSGDLDRSGAVSAMGPDRIFTVDLAELPAIPEPKMARSSGLGAVTLAVVVLVAIVCVSVGLLRGV